MTPSQQKQLELENKHIKAINEAYEEAYSDLVTSIQELQEKMGSSLTTTVLHSQDRLRWKLEKLEKSSD